MVKWFIAAILLLPLAEIAAFVLVAMAIGLGPAFGLLMLTSILGALVLRRAGRGQLAHFRAAVSNNGVTGIEAGGGVLTVLAGLLLFLPGFVTGVLGAVLLLGPVQRCFGKLFHRFVARGAPADPAVVDLKPNEWQQMPERRIESDFSRRDRD